MDDKKSVGGGGGGVDSHFVPNFCQKLASGQRSMGTLVIEATELKSEVRFGLQGHLEATMASEAS